MRAIVATLCVTLISIVTLTAPSRACWDGSLTTVGGIHLQDFDEVWSARKAVENARWLTRINLLLGDDKSLEIWPDAQLSVGDETVELRWDGDLARLYDRIARKLGVNRIRAAVTRHVEVPVWTIQAGTFTSARLAVGRAELIGGQCSHGFYEAGGFPADNSSAHVERTVDGHYRVIVGTYLTRAEAEEATSCLSEIRAYSDDDGDERTVRIDGFVRRLDRPSFVALAPPSVEVAGE